MNRYRNIENDEVLTEDELREEYETRKRNGDLEDYYDTFGYWLNCCMTYNNGSLEKIAPNYEINRLQRGVAMEIACGDEIPYGEVLEILQQYNCFGNWTEYELNHRPVDVEELREMVYEELIMRREK